MKRAVMMLRADRICEVLTIILIGSTSVSISIAEGQFYYTVIFAAALVTAVGTRRYASTQARRAGLERSQKWLATAAVVWLIAEWFPLQRAEVVTLGHFVMLLCSIIVLSPRHARDMTVLMVLALLLLVIGAIVSSNLAFGVAVVLFTMLFPYAVGRHLLRTAAERSADALATLRATANAAPAVDRPIAGRGGAGFLSGSLKISAVALLIGVLLFFAFPRFGTQIGQWRASSAAMVTGDSTDVIVTDPGNVQLSDRPVMRVWLERDGHAVGPNQYTPYFRSAAMDRYRRRGRGRFDWTRSPASARRSIVLQPRHTLDVLAAATDLPDDESAWLDQYYEFLVRADHRLYAVYPPMAFESPDLDDASRSVSDQSVIIATRHRRRGAQYMIRSPWRIDAATDRLLVEQNASARGPLLDHARSRNVPEEIAPIARRVARISSDDGTAVTRRRAADRIREYLTSDEFQYTLQLESGPSDVDPVVHFLTTLRRGHCQYFASAMVLMCQSLGIPSRVAVGYCGGDYNKVGGYFLVRESHAHAWAEVYVPGEGWVTFDPSPTQYDDDGGSGWLAWIKSVLQLAQYEWITRVVAFDREQRRRLFEELVTWFTAPFARGAGAVQGVFTSAAGAVTGVRRSGPATQGLVAVVAMLAAIGLLLALRTLKRAVARRRCEQHRFTRRQQARFMGDVLDALARLGFRRRPSQTPKELVDSLPAQLGFRQPCRQLVQLYYRTQYGGQPLSSEDASRVSRWLTELRSADRPETARRS